MKRRKFLQSSLNLAAANTVSAPAIAPATKEIYEWREYEMRFGADEALLENYLQAALIPALNKYGVKTVCVFKDWKPSEPAKLHVLVPYASLEAYLAVDGKVKTDPTYLQNSASYHRIAVEKALYSRFNSSLMIAFDGFRNMVLPAGQTRMFELRTYEGYSEDAVRRKIRMFHDGEFPIFERAKLKPVFFGKVIAGDKLPRLTYLITCQSIAERNKGWDAFVADPEWKRLGADPQNAHTISKISNTFLVPRSYSQV